MDRHRSNLRVWLVVLIGCCGGAEAAYASPFAYVPNSGSGTVSVIDTATDSVVATTAPISTYIQGAAVVPDGTRVYLAGLLGSVYVLNAFTNTVTASIPMTFTGPPSVAVNPAGTRVYASAHPYVSVIDTATNTLLTDISDPAIDNPQQLVVTPDGSKLYVTNVFGGANLVVINTATNAVIAALPLAGSRGLDVLPDGSKVYAADQWDGETVVTDTATDTVITSIVMPTSPLGVVAHPDGSKVYVSRSGAVSVINTTTEAITTDIPVGGSNFGIAIHPNGDRVYVTDISSNTVYIIDTSSNAVIGSVPVGTEPFARGRFIGPAFVCGNGTTEPGETCDDGNTIGGDGCSADCFEEHDSVVVAVKPISVKIGAGKISATKKVKVKVRNADVLPSPEMPGHTVELNASSDCPSLVVSTPDFGTGTGNQILLAGGETGKATVLVTVTSSAFTSFNLKAPTRCTLTFTAESVNSSEPTASNNVATAEVNILDKNDPEQTAVHESVLHSLKPITVTVKDLAATASKTAKPKVANADYLPTAEAATAHSISVTAVDGDCPALTVGAVTFASLPSIEVEGGKSKAGALPLTVGAAAFSSPSALSPARCTAVLTAVGPAGDTDPTNDQTRLTIDVIDENDF